MSSSTPILETTVNTRVQGLRLVGIRALWVVVVIWGLTMNVMGIKQRYIQLMERLPDTIQNDGASRADEQLSVSEIAVLEQQYGYSHHQYALYVLVLELITVFIYLLMSSIIFWYRSDDWMAILTAIGVLALGISAPTIDDALADQDGRWHWWVEGFQFFAVCAFNFIFFFFPDGRAVPRWTRPLAIGGVTLAVLWLLFPWLPGNQFYGTTWQETLPISLAIVLFWGGTGLLAQTYRYRFEATELQKRQIVLIVFSFALMLTGGTLRQLMFVSTTETPELSLLLNLLRIPMTLLFGSTILAAITVAVLRYRLWDIDIIIRRTTIYTLLSALLILIYVGVTQTFQLLLKQFAFGIEFSTPVAVLAVVALWRPLHDWIQQLIDKTFYRNRIDFQQAFTGFSREIRPIIHLPTLLDVSNQQITNLFHSEYGVLYLRNEENELHLENRLNMPADKTPSPQQIESYLQQIANAPASLSPLDNDFPILLPLTTPHAGGAEVVGALALGPRRSEQPYSKNDQAVLMSMAEQAGTAIAVVQSIETERRLDEYRASPRGQADLIAEQIDLGSTEALQQLYQLARDPSQSNLLANLVPALRDRSAETIAGIAEGFQNVIASQAAPEKFSVGLQQLVLGIESLLSDSASKQSALKLALNLPLASLQWCRTALRLSKATDVAQHRLQTPEPAQLQTMDTVDGGQVILKQLITGLKQINLSAEPFSSYAHVSAAEDQITYLLKAIGQLDNYSDEVLATIEPPDRFIMQQVVAHWHRLATQALSAIRNQASIEAKLVTERVVAQNQVTLSLEISNSGRGPATDLVVEIQIDDKSDFEQTKITISQLLPGQVTQCTFCIEPMNDTHCSVTFRIEFDDQSQTKRSQLLHSVVYLMPIPAEFRAIPNPYAAGRPLQLGSPIFFGREDLFEYIHEKLETSSDGAVLVLTGQKRMGKTSLLKQMPAQLPEYYQSVYLDMQGVGQDGGLASFFYDLAFGIADQLGLPEPEFEHFAERPKGIFEQEFLPQILKSAVDKRLVLLFDEFEELEMRVQSGRLGKEVFSYLRYLIQAYPQLAFIFVGTHQLEELTPEYWSTFFNLALYRHIGFLDNETAQILITAPVESLLFYDDLAIDKMMRLTSGHPYFLQLLCYLLVNAANQEERNYVDINHVNQVIDEVLNQSHLIFMWQQLSTFEQRLLEIVTSLIGNGHVPTLSLIMTTFNENIQPSDQEATTELQVKKTLTSFVQREVLRADSGTNATYGFVVDLFRLWIARRAG